MRLAVRRVRLRRPVWHSTAWPELLLLHPVGILTPSPRTSTLSHHLVHSVHSTLLRVAGIRTRSRTHSSHHLCAGGATGIATHSDVGPRSTWIACCLPSRSTEVGLSGLAGGGSRTPELSTVSLVAVAFVLLRRRSVGLPVLLTSGCCHHGGRRIGISSVAVSGAGGPEAAEIPEPFQPGKIVAEQVGEVLHRGAGTVSDVVKIFGETDDSFEIFRLKKFCL